MRSWSVLWLIAGCSKGSGKIDDVTFVPGAIPGTGQVTFSTEQQGDARVQFVHPDSGLTISSASVPARDGAIPVYGLPTGKELELEVVIDTGDKELTSKPLEVTVAPPTDGVVPIESEWINQDLACDEGGYFLFSFLGAGVSGVAIIDRYGNYVWTKTSRDTKQSIARVRPGRNGKDLLYSYYDEHKKEDVAHVVRMPLDGSSEKKTRTLQGHHDFVELPDGKIGFMAFEFQEMWATPRDEGPHSTPRELGPEGKWVFGGHTWRSTGGDLSVVDAGKENIDLVLLAEDIDGDDRIDGEADRRTYSITTTEGGSSVTTSGTFQLDLETSPWSITLNQEEPEVATLQGLIEVHAGTIRLEVVQTVPDIGLLPPDPEDGLGSTTGPGYNEGDNVLTFRRRVTVAGDAIYEVDEGTTEVGNETIVWSAFEDYPNGEGYPFNVYRLPFDGQQTFLHDSFEFGHGNSMGYVESQSSYYMMWRWLDTLLKIGRDGSWGWQWGGEPEHNELQGDPATIFKHAHFSDVWDGGILIFDNRNPQIKSRLVEYSLTDTSYEQVWEYQESNPKFENLLGDVRRMPGGCDNVLVSWSGQGRISEITRDGQMVWDMGISQIGAVTSRVYYLPDLYDMSGLAYPE